MPNVVPPEEIGQLVEECRAYQMDADMLLRVPNYIEEDCRVDIDWWSHVASLKNSERGVRYPTLCKLVKALLSIFTGPLVEGSFNLMDDILESDRCSMNVETYESLAVIKSTLIARDWTASTMNIDQPLRRSCLCSFQNYQLHLKKKKETAQALKQKRLSEAARILSSKEANKLAQQARKIKRQNPPLHKPPPPLQKPPPPLVNRPSWKKEDHHNPPLHQSSPLYKPPPPLVNRPWKKEDHPNPPLHQSPHHLHQHSFFLSFINPKHHQTS